MPDYALPETLDRAASCDAANALSDLISTGATIAIDGSAVRQIGQAGIQMLISSFATGKNRSATIKLVEPSEPLCAAARMTATHDLLGC